MFSSTIRDFSITIYIVEDFAMYNLQCIMYIVQIQSAMYNVQCTMYIQKSLLVYMLDHLDIHFNHI